MKRLLVALALLALIVINSATFTVSAVAAAPASALGDLTGFESIVSETLVLVQKGDLKAAQARITDFETAWDRAEPTLYPMNHDQWGFVDDAADIAISSLRASAPVKADAATAVIGLIAALQNPAGH